MRMQKNFFLTILSLILFPGAFAHAGPKIFYIGGIGSTSAHMKVWASSARAQLPGYEIEAVAVSPGAAFQNKVVQEILANQDREYIIAGHSEGASTVTSLTARLDALAAANKVNPLKLRLIKLEGYSFSAKNLKYECWFGQGRNGSTGFNGVQMKKCASANVRRYCDRQCKTSVCLHFSVVNKAAPPDLGRPGLDLSHGYDNINANVTWAKEGSGQNGCN